jgi:hypothetical protein
MLKYIITKNNEVIIGNVGHWELSRGVRESVIISAGHCGIEDGKVKVWGKSATFDIPSREEDADIITKIITK